MYYLFKEKNILPHQFYNLSIGEKVVTRALFEFDMEKRREFEEELKTKARIDKLHKRRG